MVPPYCTVIKGPPFRKMHKPGALIKEVMVYTNRDWIQIAFPSIFDECGFCPMQIKKEKKR